MRFSIAALALAAAAVAGPALAQAPLKIGFIAELSGPQGALGQDQYDGFMLYVEQQGGRLGGVPVQVLREDTQLKPEVAVQAVHKLIEREGVPIITGVTFSNIMMAIHKPVTERQVFLISSLSGPSPIAGAQCSPYQFVTSFQLDAAAEAHHHAVLCCHPRIIRLPHNPRRFIQPAKERPCPVTASTSTAPTTTSLNTPRSTRARAATAASSPWSPPSWPRWARCSGR